METEKFGKGQKTIDGEEEDSELKEHYMIESVAAIDQLVKVFRLL